MSMYAYIDGQDAFNCIKEGFEHKQEAEIYPSQFDKEEPTASVSEYVRIPVIDNWIDGGMYIDNNQLHISIRCNKYREQVVNWLIDNQIRFVII